MTKLSILCGFKVCILTLLALHPVWADDIEIFFSPVAQESTQPNILFVLDASASMEWYDCKNGTISKNQSCNDGTVNGTVKRVDRMIDAMNQVLAESENINVGVMRFGGYDGGRVLVPVTNINGTVCTDGSCGQEFTVEAGAAGIVHTKSAVDAGSGVSDSLKFVLARQSSTGYGGKSERAIDGNTSGVWGHGSVTHTNSESEAWWSGDLTGDESIKEITLWNRTNCCSNRLTNFYLMVSDQPFNSNDLAATLADPNVWSFYHPGTVGESVTIPVNTNGQYVRVQLKGTGFLSLAEVEVIGEVNKLHAAALQFSDLGIPQGATIKDARIAFTPEIDNRLNDLKVRVEDLPDSAPFGADIENTIDSRSWSSDSVTWTNPAWTASQEALSPDLSGLLEPLVQHTGWCGGNAVTFQMTDAVASLKSAFHDNTGSPVLKVSYSMENIPSTGGCNRNTVVLDIDSGTADAHELADGTVSDQSDSDQVTADQMIGYQFENLPIEQGTNISSARLSLVPANWDTANHGEPFVAKVSLENTASPLPFASSVGNLSNRSRTAGVKWAAPLTLSQDQRVYTSDFSAQLSTIVQGSAWAKGNRISVFIEHVSGSGVRGYMSENSHSPQFSAKLELVFDAPVTAIEGSMTLRERVKMELDDLETVLATPTVGALEEAVRYYAGEPMLAGKTRAKTRWVNDDKKSRVSAPDSYTGGKLERDPQCLSSNLSSAACRTEHVSGDPVYISPIKHECQSNHVVVLTDGAPWVKNGGTIYTNVLASMENRLGQACTSTGWGKCGVEMAAHMKNTDFRTDLPDVPAKQNITTHTIGFNIKSNWIKDVAAAGGGGYYEAESTLDLIKAIANIVEAASGGGNTFVAPAVTVDQFSRISHREDVYLALFSPVASASWPGNLKRYNLGGDPIGLRGQDPDLLAVDPDTGSFVASSQSSWALEQDGADIALGGAAALLNPNSRNIVSNLDSNNNNLLTSGNSISIGNGAITPGSFGVGSDLALQTLLDWLTGFDVKDENDDGSTVDYRYHIGDPLHSTPVVLTYAGTGDTEGVVFVGTNEGFLHAFDIEDGSEDFAFMPQELFSNVPVLFDDRTIAFAVDTKPYGLDGNLTLWTSDQNHNGLVDTGETAIVIAGMRRGGKSYYALDVSDRSAPSFKWHIQGGSGDFAELGQSWSKPIAGRIQDGNTVKDVLVFGGGYDPSQDGKSTRSEDNIGRAIYIVDVTDGSLIWSGGPSITNTTTFSDMKYSIPSDLKIINDGGDNLISQIYVGDMGGQIWRFDINNGESGSNLVDGGVIAELGEDGSLAGNRRFYHPVDLSLARDGGERILNVAVGSGYQAHPLYTSIEDKFFVFQYPYDGNGKYNYGIKDADSNRYEAITLSDLFDTTDNKIAEGTEAEISTAKQGLASSHGWYITMEGNGEKILGASSTLNNVVKFISYEPETVSEGCNASVGSSYYWAVNLLDGTPYDPNEDYTDDGSSTNGTTDLTREDRKREIPSGGLAPAVNTVFVASDPNQVIPVDMSGLNVLQEWDNINTQKRWFWSEYPE